MMKMKCPPLSVANERGKALAWMPQSRKAQMKKIEEEEVDS